MQKNILKKHIGKLIFLVPLTLGTVGLVSQGIPVLDALFSAVQMYALGYSEGKTPLLVEIARWTAPLATASGVILAMHALRKRLHCLWVYATKNSVAVYGPEQEKEELLTHLGPRGMDPEGRFVRAHSYILAGSENENLNFYDAHRHALAKRTVYLKCSSISAQSTAYPNLHLYSHEEIAGRLFWQEHCLYSLSRQTGHKLDIVLIGFGHMGEELLLYGLQYNIFHPNQRITYHVFDGDKSFAAIRPGLARIQDPVIFHSTPWHEHLSLITTAAMVIVLPQDNPLALLKQLTLSSTREHFHVFAPESCGLNIMDQKHRLQLFDWHKISSDPKNLFQDTLNRRAKAINLRYAHLYRGIEENETNKELEWASLNTFTRYSNISAADYHEVQRRILLTEGLPAAYDQIPPEWKELLSELEHIRWCRYHYLNNWSFGKPVNGKNKDEAARIHVDLVEYQSLTDSEKNKDRENIRTLFTLEE